VSHSDDDFDSCLTVVVFLVACRN